jgi:transcriptional regulator with XRE-family HTH domain
MLAAARRIRGWTQAEAAERCGVSRVGMLEAGQRLPRATLTEAAIAAYELDHKEAELPRSVALHNVGRDSPHKQDA